MIFHFYSVHFESKNADPVLLKNKQSSKSLAHAESRIQYLEKDHVNFISRNAINLPLKGRLTSM